MTGTIVAVHRSAAHTFSKASYSEIALLAGLGVDGDAHAGVTVKHRSRVERDPTQVNLRQVHLLQAELLEELGIHPGALGENITTRGLDLLALSAGTQLRLGSEAIVEVTGLRNPCVQIEAFRTGALKRVVRIDDAGEVVRRAGVMSVVVTAGTVRPGEAIGLTHPGVFLPLQRV